MQPGNIPINNGEAEIMKKRLLTFAICNLFAIVISLIPAAAQQKSLVNREFNLAGKHSPETQYFIMESKLVTYSLDGKRDKADIFRLHLKCVPAKIAGTEGDEYTCIQFTVKQEGGSEVTIPALENWTYVFKRDNEKGEVLGIDHGKFEHLVDSKGKMLPAGIAYHVYNAFIDFHTFNNVFAEKTDEGNGIQDLTKIGQKIVHAAAFSEPPVNLGSNVSKGSFFKNGEITLEFKGLGVANDRECALLGYDSGESSYKMIMEPMPNMKVETVGSSHYFGDIYKDLKTNWVQKATLHEFVVSETTLPMPPNKINGVVERTILVRNVSEKEFNSK